MHTYRAHIFKQAQVGSREEVKIKMFTMDGAPLHIPGTGSSEELEEPTTLSEHVYSETPHPTYDDGPSLSLLYENAKV